MSKKTELSDDEIETRSVLMRLYHSHYVGEDSYPAVHVNGQAAEMAARGWIERCGDGWRITQIGILEWAKMNQQSLGHKWASESSQFDELRTVLHIDFQASERCKREGCNQPRKRSASGAEYSYCEKHMRLIWAANKQKRYRG